ncbi:hypothetical protein Golob_016808 [Gossypium lobatum]|uniref:Uncharacterized protein n=1 Tax=Gossypium lobatum TaxID=34289 RepID=A0A7J8M589_9ROSI|nr:hypothetical protein [Gossypium lobatum]
MEQLIEDLEQRLLVECCLIRIGIGFSALIVFSKNATSLRLNFGVFWMA